MPVPSFAAAVMASFNFALLPANDDGFASTINLGDDAIRLCVCRCGIALLERQSYNHRIVGSSYGVRILANSVTSVAGFSVCALQLFQAPLTNALSTFRERA